MADGASKAPYNPVCDHGHCPRIVTHVVYDKFGNRIPGEFCEEHADVRVKRLDDYQARIDRASRR